MDDFKLIPNAKSTRSKRPAGSVVVVVLVVVAVVVVVVVDVVVVVVVVEVVVVVVLVVVAAVVVGNAAVVVAVAPGQVEEQTDSVPRIWVPFSWVLVEHQAEERRSVEAQEV